MFSVIKNFALSYAPPEPGCEYEFRPDPTWGEVPVGQICENNGPTYIIIIALVGLVLVAGITYLLIRKAKKEKLKK